MTACLFSLVISTLASYFFFSKWSESEDRASKMVIEKNSLSRNYVQLKNSFDKLFNDLNILRNENARVITVQSLDSMKHDIARIYWNPYSRQTFIDVISLPRPDSTMQYRLWSSSMGKFIDMGIVEVNDNEEIQQMKPAANVDGWFVTLEQKNQTESPNMHNIWLAIR